MVSKKFGKENKSKILSGSYFRFRTTNTIWMFSYWYYYRVWYVYVIKIKFIIFWCISKKKFLYWRLLSDYTEDQQYKAILRQTTIENTTKQFIEIWDKQKLIKNYDLAALDVHGDVYTDCNY